MAEVKNYKMPGRWAENAYTTIPQPPVTGLSYRNDELTEEETNTGQRYGSLGDSATWNQLLWAMSGIAKSLEEQGALSWSPLIDYNVGALVMGTDDHLYIALQPSGPNTKLVNPATEESEDMTWLDVTAKLQDEGTSIIPAGTVVAFSGSFGGERNRNPIPRGSSTPDTAWVLCDGGSDGLGGNVPDLRGRFILGASVNHEAGEIGGAETSTVSMSGNVDATTLTVQQIPSHNHTVTAPTTGDQGLELTPNWNVNPAPKYGEASATSSSTGGGASHTHSVNAVTASVATLPPYYALAYIMKVA